MRQRLLVLLYLTVFWLLFFVVIRALFLTYNTDLSSQLVTGEVVRIFVNGFRMDLSMTGYFIMAAALLLSVSLLTVRRWPYFVLSALTIFLVVVCSLIAGVDMELYRHWGFRLNTAPLFYLESATHEALGSVALSVVFKLLLLCAALATVFIFLYDRVLVPKIATLSAGKARESLVLVAVAAMMIVPIRGSFTVAPMNTGFVYFHKTKPYANHAAINVVWNFLYFLHKGSTQRYTSTLVPEAIAHRHFRALYPPTDSATTHLWKVKRPNIILFILESFTADVVEPLGGRPGVTPNLSALCREGVLFTNFYASGDRTDKGIVSILSGYPAQPVTSIIKNPAKTQRLPYLNHYMRELGYQTSFVYGGDIDFANFRSYLTNSRFDHITSEDDFPSELNHSKWGVHDHIVFQRALQECDTASQPFFKVILSLSSHEPFDVPMVARFPGNDEESLFINSCYYTDKCIGDFVVKAKTSPWWENSVIIFVADHGHRLPGHRELKDKERFRIPFLMTGGAIKGDTVITKFGSQTDIANTLLAQLSRPSPSFSFSKDLLSPSSGSFAAYFFNDGYGFITPREYIVFDNVSKRFIRADGAQPEDLEQSKSYEQVLFADYNNR